MQNKTEMYNQINDAIEASEVYELVQLAKQSDEHLHIIISKLCEKAHTLEHIKKILTK